MTPLERYRKQCQQGLVHEDPEQLMVLSHLDNISHALVREHQLRRHVLNKLRRPKLIKGLYVWGGVGIGKTFMMDCFYESLPFQAKKRLHFHHFMQWIHHELKLHQGQKDPLKIIAKKLAKQTLVLCFDEFFVKDIADAMLLARLLTALFANGVCLVATSNTQPDELYWRGLQRESFLPAIELIKTHTRVIHLTTQIDYRLRHLKDAGVFYMPNDEKAHAALENAFAIMANGHVISHDPIEIHERFIPINKQSGEVIWFDFDVLCSVPRSQQDYLEIAKRYRTVLISNIPVIPPQAKDKISLLIHLIDVFYDAHVRLVFSAADQVSQLYPHGYLQADFKRAQSRLIEMQSQHYFLEE
jgi:cell division protein ZapE